MILKNEYLVEKRNLLNEIRANSMTLQELRFFSIYLAKINSRDITTRLVRFSLEDFQKIMELGRLNIEHLSRTVDSLLCKIVGVPRDDGGLDRFQLFKKGTIAPDENGWYIEINAHDDALPLMFEFKEKYFTYELWNALRLRSANQLRMYEILKQSEWQGVKIISVKGLRELLGIGPKEYTRFGDFRADVLDVCQKALEEHTDIKFTCEPTGKRGKGGKILTLKFTITKNTNYVDQLSLSEFIESQIENDVEKDEEACTSEERPPHIEFLSPACNDEFSDAEMQLLYDMLMRKMPYGSYRQIDWYDYLKLKYDELNWRATRTNIPKRFEYLKKMIESGEL